MNINNEEASQKYHILWLSLCTNTSNMNSLGQLAFVWHIIFKYINICIQLTYYSWMIIIRTIRLKIPLQDKLHIILPGSSFDGVCVSYFPLPPNQSISCWLLCLFGVYPPYHILLPLVMLSTTLLDNTQSAYLNFKVKVVLYLNFQYHVLHIYCFCHSRSFNHSIVYYWYFLNHITISLPWQEKSLHRCPRHIFVISFIETNHILCNHVIGVSLILIKGLRVSNRSLFIGGQDISPLDILYQSIIIEATEAYVGCWF